MMNAAVLSSLADSGLYLVGHVLHAVKSTLPLVDDHDAHVIAMEAYYMSRMTCTCNACNPPEEEWSLEDTLMGGFVEGDSFVLVGGEGRCACPLEVEGWSSLEDCRRGCPNRVT